MKYANVGKSLRVAKALKDIRNIDLASKFGVKPQQVIQWRNSSDMSLHKVQELAQYFEMSLNEFLKHGMKG